MRGGDGQCMKVSGLETVMDGSESLIRKTEKKKVKQKNQKRKCAHETGFEAKQVECITTRSVMCGRFE